MKSFVSISVTNTLQNEHGQVKKSEYGQVKQKERTGEGFIYKEGKMTSFLADWAPSALNLFRLVVRFLGL